MHFSCVNQCSRRFINDGWWWCFYGKKCWLTDPKSQDSSPLPLSPGRNDVTRAHVTWMFNWANTTPLFIGKLSSFHQTMAKLLPSMGYCRFMYGNIIYFFVMGHLWPTVKTGAVLPERKIRPFGAQEASKNSISHEIPWKSPRNMWFVMLIPLTPISLWVSNSSYISFDLPIRNVTLNGVPRITF